MTSKSQSKWAAPHLKPAGPGDARPTALDIIRDEGLINQWSDKVVLITGASSGIGVETARALYATGAHLFLPVRDVAKGEAVAADIRHSAPDSLGRITVLSVSLESLQSVREMAAAFLRQSSSLHLLICNAGVMATPEGVTADGWETQFGTNHLSHFLLTQLLLPSLLRSSTPSYHSRVIAVSSSGHGFATTQPTDYNLKQRGYDPWVAYGQSKTANIFMANEIDRRYGAQGVHALSVHPGGIMTGLQVHLPAEQVEGWAKNEMFRNFFKSPEQGAATTVWAATAKVWEGKGGKFLEDCHEAEPKSTDPALALLDGYATWAYDQQQAAQLWEDSLKMVGEKGEQ